MFHHGIKDGGLGRFQVFSLAAVFLTVCAEPSDGREGVEGDPALFDLVKAAQTRNLELDAYKQGRLEFSVVFQYPSSPGHDAPRPVRVRGQVTWKGDDHALWAFRAQDPDKVAFGVPLTADLEDVPLQYLMLNGDKLYGYNFRANNLYIRPFNGVHGISDLLDVMPRAHWFRCCPPHHIPGRPWIESIGPAAPVVRPGDTLSIERDGDFVRQTRVQPNGSTSTTTFSLEWDGNIVSHRYFDSERNAVSKLIRYEWGRVPSGVCVLKSCEAKEFKPGSETEVDWSYQLEIESVELDRPVFASEVSPEALLSMLPSDVVIDDDVTGKRYYANRDVKLPQSRFDQLAEIVSSEGFLKKED